MTTKEHPKVQPKKAAVPAIIPTIKKGALSLDVGPMVVSGLSKVNEDLSKADAIFNAANQKRYHLLAAATQAIVKAKEHDDSLDLSATLKTGAEGTAAMAKLNEQIYLALGIKKVVEVTKGNATVKKLTYTEAVAKHFPSPADVKGSDEWKAKQTLRTNLVAQLKKCAMTAHAIIDRGITSKVDKAAGTLRLSGPTIKKEFGASEILLNEKQKVSEGTGKKAKEITLSQKPSFTAVAELAAKAAGAQLKRGRMAGGGASILDPNKAIVALADSVVKACEAIDVPNETQQKALEKMQAAIEKVLG